MMEKVCRKIACKITSNAGLSGEKQAVAVYGMLAIMQLIAILALVFAITIPLNCYLEAIIVFSLAGFLRRFIGGAHAGSLGVCTVISTAVISLLAFACRYFLSRISFVLLLIFCIFVFVIGGILIWLLAPVDNKNKRINKPEKLRNLRVMAAICVFIFAALCFLCIVYPASRSFGCAICVATLWQTLMLPVSKDRKLRINVAR